MIKKYVFPLESKFLYSIVEEIRQKIHIFRIQHNIFWDTRVFIRFLVLVFKNIFRRINKVKRSLRDARRNICDAAKKTFFVTIKISICFEAILAMFSCEKRMHQASSPCKGEVDPAYSNLETLWGEVDPASSNLETLWGEVDPASSNLETLWGEVDPASLTWKLCEERLTQPPLTWKLCEEKLTQPPLAR